MAILVAALATALFCGARAVAERGPGVVELSDVPAPARAAIERQAGGRPILAVSTRSGRHGEVAYEALIAGVEDTVAVVVDDKGAPLGRFIIPRAAGLDGR